MAAKKETKTIKIGIKATITRDVGTALVESILELTTKAQHKVEKAKSWKVAFNEAIELLGRYARILDDTAQISETSILALDTAWGKFYEYTKPTYDKFLKAYPTEAMAPTKLWFRFGVANCFPKSMPKDHLAKGKSWFIKNRWGPIEKYWNPELAKEGNQEITLIEVHNRELQPDDFMSWDEFLKADPKRTKLMKQKMSA